MKAEAFEGILRSYIANGVTVRDNLVRRECQRFNEMRDEYNTCTDEIDKEILLERLKTQAMSIVFAGYNPKDVPTSLLKYAIQNPMSGDGRPDMDARARVRNPNTGIRAYCIKCMGGQPGLVRQCSSMLCPLWSFRMGTNPFFGRLTDTDAEAEVVEDYAAEEAQEDADKQPIVAG